MNESLAALTSSVSHPPTMLSPKPTFPLQISMVVSLPATTGQLRGPEVVGDNLSQSDLSVKQVCVVLRDEEEEVTGVGWTEAGEREPGRERDVGRGREEEGDRFLDRLTESLTAA